MYEYSFGQVSGMHIDDLSAVGSRAESIPSFDWTSGESHVYEKGRGTISTEMPTPGLFAGIWRSSTGKVHVAHRDGAFFERQANGKYTRHDVRASLLGVWGLDDDQLYGWGLAGDRPVMFRKHSERWEAVESPAHLVFALAGDAPDRLLAVGANGAISSWDGQTWTGHPSPVQGALSSIHWISETEVYACGPGSPYILARGANGWSRRGPYDRPLHCVAKFAERLWVGCGVAGLHALTEDGSAMELIKPNIAATFFDPRGDLVIGAANAIVGTNDGQAFVGATIDSYRELADRLPPTWR